MGNFIISLKGQKQFIKANKKAVRAALAKTVNDLKTSIVKQIATEIKAEYPISAANIKRSMVITPATIIDPVAIIDLTERSPNVANFKGIQKFERRYSKYKGEKIKYRVGVQYKWKNQKKNFVPHSFLIHFGSGKILAYYRAPGADEIKNLTASSIPHLIETKKIKSIKEKQMKRAKPIFERHLKFYRKKYFG